jgi:hypothetical protein
MAYEYQEHPHIEARKAKGPAVSKRHHASKAKLGLNERIGLAVTKRVGTMWAAYAFFGLSLVSLPAALSSGNEVVILLGCADLLAAGSVADHYRGPEHPGQGF